jgi:hypothetical protein
MVSVKASELSTLKTIAGKAGELIRAARKTAIEQKV